MTSISLCMIVRDEAQTLARCLESVRGVVDQICVVDTGSVDGTARIAAQFGAVIADEPWHENFAQARNLSLGLAGGDWALVLDADEWLELGPDGAAAVRRALLDFAKRHPRAIGRVQVRNLDGERELSRVSIGRFFPLGAGLAYRGRIHEHLAESGGERWPQIECGVTLLHDGYAGEQVNAKRKLTRNLALLERWTKEAPEDGYAWYQLGRTLGMKGDHEHALDALRTALEHSHDEDAWPVHAVELAAASLDELGLGAQALDLVNEACELAPQRPDTLFLRSNLQLRLGAVEDARAGFEACLALPAPSGSTESWAGANSYAAAHNLGVIAECTGNTEQARGWYDLALTFEPNHAPSVAGLERTRASGAGLPTGGSIG
jgi:tetratricopeptide (TPR) repeat protein